MSTLNMFKDGFPLIFGYFSLSKRQTALWLLFSIKEVQYLRTVHNLKFSVNVNALKI